MTKIKMFYYGLGESVEDEINEFLKDKLFISIQANGGDYIVVYKEKPKDTIQEKVCGL